VISDPINPPLRSPFSALVVEPSDVDAVFLVSALTTVGFSVTLTDNFADAKSLLNRLTPLVLVTEVRLGAYNGLQLAFQTRSAPRRITVVVTSAVADPVLQRDAERAGATFVSKPIATPDLLAAVFRTALRRPNPDGTVAPIRPPFERRKGDRRKASDLAIDTERRQADRRRDIANLMIRAVSLT
jgi:DNA-binding response OmpR family regulator